MQDQRAWYPQPGLGRPSVRAELLSVRAELVEALRQAQGERKWEGERSGLHHAFSVAFLCFAARRERT